MPAPYRRQIEQPIFRVTSLRKMFAEAYSILGLGFVLGLVVGAMIWR